MSSNVSVTFDDLQEQVADLKTRHPNLKNDDAFVAWFLRAYVTDREEEAIEAVAGGVGDKGIDAVLVDDRSKCVFIVQAKYRERIAAKSESRNDVLGFARLAETLSDPDAMRSMLDHLEPYTSTLLTRAHQRLTKNNYRLWLYYVTLGTVSKPLVKEAAAIASRASTDASVEILAGKRLLTLLRDYLDGAAPPIPTLDLDMEKSNKVTVNGILQRYDRENDVESWVFAMRGSDVAEVFRTAGVRLFARNIRGFIGEGTPVNRGIGNTLNKEPDHFFYYNNGITIICDRAEKRSNMGRDLLRVSNPQVINGQQTCRMLAAYQKESGAASVLVKVMQVPRDDGRSPEAFERLVSAIVAGTNWQNAIKPSDLMSNDRRQIDLERALRKLGYAYLRKRQTKGEIRAQFGGKKYRVIKKEELAQAVAGCDLDPVVARSGKDNLFDEYNYESVFGLTDPEEYLARYWLFYEVTYWAKGYPQRAYLKWLVLGFVWKHLSPYVRTRAVLRQFRQACERQQSSVVDPLGKAIGRAYGAALKYYTHQKGRGAKALDISLFFRSKKGRQHEFAEYWTPRKNASRRAFDRALQKVATAVVEYDAL